MKNSSKPQRELGKAAVPEANAVKRTSGPHAISQDVVTLRLYIAGQTPKSLAALANLKKICDDHLVSKHKIQLEVVDLMEKPEQALTDQILAIPTLIRKLPSPVKRIIGDLSNTERVLVGLDIRENR